MTHATSKNQFSATNVNTLPATEWVRPDTLAIALPMDENTVSFTLTYVLVDADGAGHVVDPGTDANGNFERLIAEAEAHGITEFASSVSTHLHPDHLGLAERLRTERGARLALGEIEYSALRSLHEGSEPLEQAYGRWGVPAGLGPELPDVRRSGLVSIDAPDVLLADGDVLDIPGRTLEALVTPGHTAGHVCLRDAASGLFFSGDHVLPMVYPGLGLGGGTVDNPIGAYLASLTRASAFDDHEVLPGHGYRFRGLADRCENIRGHHLTRSREVGAVLAETPDASIWDIASRVKWTAGWQNLSGFLLYSALAQTEMHVSFLRSPAAGL